MEQKSKFVMAGSRGGVPTLEELLAMFRQLTGREPTAEDIDEARAEYARMREEHAHEWPRS